MSGSRVLLVTLLVLVPGCALAQEWREVVSPRTRVLFDDPALEEYAGLVAVRAEEALDVLAGLFGSVPRLTTIRLDSETDLYNAIAPPLPRPQVVMPALFPALPQVDLGTSDPLYALLLHELTHVVQLGYLERPAELPPLPQVGLVGEDVAPLPPGWLLEGLAVWVAGEHAPGAAVLDARTRGVLHALTLEGEWPSLEDVSLLSHSEWPGGEARYLLGGAFVAYIIEEYGWETLLASLREANAGWYPLPFEAAWRRASGEGLEEVWEAWTDRVEEEASDRAAALPERFARGLTGAGAATTVLAADPSGDRLAWRPAGGGLVLSELSSDSQGRLVISNSRRLLPPFRSPISLDWLGPDRLVYTRLAPGPGTRFTDLFELDLTSGDERRLSHGARARFARAGPEGCVYYVRDVAGEGSSVMRRCAEDPAERLFLAPAGRHLVGLDVSDGGRIVVSLWLEGQVDLAILEEGELRVVFGDSTLDLDPAWVDEDELLFRSDASGVFDIYGLRLEPYEARRLTAEVGGAFAPSPLSDEVIFARVGGEGLDLATVPLAGRVPGTRLQPSDARTTPPHDSDDGYAVRSYDDTSPHDPDAGYPVRPYEPWRSLAPFGWLPRLELAGVEPLSIGLSASLLGEDRSGDHSYSLTAGYRPGLEGPLGGATFHVRYDYRRVDAFDLFQRPDPWGFGVRFGLWRHRQHPAEAQEVVAGVGVELWRRAWLGSWLTLSRLNVSLLRLPSYAGLQPAARLDVVATRRYSDLWGYGYSGPRASAHLAWSAGSTGGTGSAWLEASQVLARSGPLPFTTTIVLSGGYRAPPPIPIHVAPWSLFGTVAARASLPVGWRYADGLLALERLTAEVRLHSAFDGALIPGADLSLWADTMLRYGAPVSVGGTLGFAEGWWYRLGLRVPL
ncbi:MAG TPA: hypothetical protein VF168_07655 [Trueperaceae bacterium]